MRASSCRRREFNAYVDVLRCETSERTFTGCSSPPFAEPLICRRLIACTHVSIRRVGHRGPREGEHLALNENPFMWSMQAAYGVFHCVIAASWRDPRVRGATPDLHAPDASRTSFDIAISPPSTARMPSSRASCPSFFETYPHAPAPNARSIRSRSVWML